MSTLRTALQRYVLMRRGLGYKFIEQERRLRTFVRFMDERKASIITRKLALEWATNPVENKSATWILRVSDIRGFARFLCSVEPRTEVLPTGMVPGSLRPRPYLYSETEITNLLRAALQLPPANGLRRWTYYCLFGLLVVSGLRISEALLLRRQDVDLQRGVLTIRKTKFGKSRLVPIHPSTRGVLADYTRRRDAHLCPPRSDYFFVAEQGGRLLLQYVHKVFWRLSREIGLRRPEDHSGPRLHDFRHRFAVQSLLSWYRQGKNVEQMLPVLSTYLGHTCVRDTYWYLSECPELMGQAVKRLQTHWGNRS